jgi:probable HAF family extracellular repeat protein
MCREIWAQGDIMNSNCSSRSTVITAVMILLVSFGLAAQQVPRAGSQHHHYQLIDLGTFGGPQAFTQDVPHYLTNGGAVVGWADTTTLDPNYPNICFFCFYGNQFISHAFQWKQNVLTDLGALPGLNSSGAFWTEENGLTVGFSENSEIDPLLGLPEMHAVLWDNGTITDLGTLGGGYQSTAFAVNSRGQAVGFSNNLVPDSFNPLGTTQERVFLWQNGVMQDLGTLGTGTDAGLLGWTGDVEINERGQVAACSYTNTTPNPTTGIPTLDPFLWDPSSGMIDLGGLGGTAGCAVGMNNHGEVIGYSDLAGDVAFHPFLWSQGVLKDLGTFGGLHSVAVSINDAGHVAGCAGDVNENGIGFLWKNGELINLGTLGPLPQSCAGWVNSKDQVVGGAATSDFVTHIAYLWENGGPMVDLNALVPPGSPLQLQQALHINDRGEIAGSGALANGDQHNFLLIPCDGNHPGIEGCDYSIVDASVVAPAPSAVNDFSVQQRMPRQHSNRFHFPQTTTGRR